MVIFLKMFVFSVVLPCPILSQPEIPTRKNHFVALWQPIDVEPGEYYFLSKFPMLPQPPKATDGHAAPSSISKMMPIGTKRKQLSLDSLLPKKKVNDKEEPMIPSSSSTHETTDNNSIKSSNLEVKLITSTTSSTAVNTGCPKDINNYINRVSTLSDAEQYIKDDTTNPGNFIETVKYGARCGNLMDEIFKDCPSNQTYQLKTSK
jgi:hypothetical protein